MVNESLTYIDTGNIFLRAMTNLRRLDLSFNKLSRIPNFEALKELRELNLSFNRIELIDNLSKLPTLRMLVLDFNKIKRIENLKNLRKLEMLSLIGNHIEVAAIFGATEPQIELKELNLSKNKIKTLKPV